MIRRIAIYIGSVVIGLLAGAIGAIATTPNIPTWYATLEKPLLNPPNWIFGPVWTILYIMIGIALAIIISAPKRFSKYKAYWWFAAQLTLNTSWSIAFFGFQSPLLGTIVIALLLISILLTAYSFYRIKPLAAYLLVPYILWVSFASYLTVGIALLN